MHHAGNDENEEGLRDDEKEREAVGLEERESTG